MFCSACGKQATGKFCWNCGAPLHDEEESAHETPSPASPSIDWQTEIEYEKVLAAPQVRNLLARQAPAMPHLSGEAFLEASAKLMHGSAPVAPVATLARDVYARLGVKTGKEHTEHYSQPVGRIIACVACSLAKGGYKLQETHQATDGCTLVYELPSDMFSFAGQLLVTIQREPNGTSVNAATSIPGQYFDWGKSKRCLAALFEGITTCDQLL